MSNYKDEMKYSSLAKIMSGIDYVIIDTCSLMEDSFPEWLDILVETKEEYLDSALPIYVLESSVKELERLSKDKKSADKRIAAKRALRILKKSKRHKVVDFVNIGANLEEKANESKEGEYEFADPKIVSLINLYRIQKNIVAITQDKKLASDILGLRSQQSVHGRVVKVYKIDENASLQPNLGEESAPARKPAKTTKKEAKKPVETKPAPKKAPTKPAKKEKDETTALLEKVLAADNRLHSILSNPTYPNDKKVADLKTQLADLEKLGAEKLGNNKLKHDANSIKEDIKRFESVPALPLKEEKPKAIPMKEPKPVTNDKKAQKKDLWYEYGQTVEDAFRNVGNHYGVVFRDPNIPYVPNVHGPINFTSDDLSKIAASFGNTLKEGQKIVKQYKTVNLMAERTQKGIKAWIDLERKLIVLPSAKSVEPVKEEAKEAIKTEEKPKQVKKIKKPAAKKEQPKAEENPKPSKEKAEAPKAEKAKPTQKKAKEEEPKPEAAKTKKPTKLEETIASDKRLKANIHNPNYPKAQKLKDVEEQIARVKKIPLKDRGELNFGLDSLKALLELLK
ncbi:MAG: hypothetical protein K6B65_01930 [Bacilli bacterium]|nr:hypothetical protein [Bacilli bacterium]